SNFCSVTVKPRASIRRPMEAAASPLPSEDTTPPVMKMYFVATLTSSRTGPKSVLDRDHVLRGVDAEVPAMRRQNSYRPARLESPQLFQSLDLLQATGLPGGKLE